MVHTGELSLVTTPSTNHRLFILAPLNTDPPQANNMTVPSPPTATAQEDTQETRTARVLAEVEVPIASHGLDEKDYVVDADDKSSLYTAPFSLADQLAPPFEAACSYAHEGLETARRLARYIAPQLSDTLDHIRARSEMRHLLQAEEEHLGEAFLYPPPSVSTQQTVRALQATGDAAGGVVSSGSSAVGGGDKDVTDVVSSLLNGGLRAAMRASPLTTPILPGSHPPHPAALSASGNHTSGTGTTKKRAIPGDALRKVYSFPTELHRFPIAGTSGLELLLTTTQSGHKELSQVGGFGYDWVSPAFRNFQENNGLARTWMGKQQCVFAVHGGVQSPLMSVSRHRPAHQHDQDDVMRGDRGDGGGGGNVTGEVSGEVRRRKAMTETPPALESMRKRIADVRKMTT